MSNSLNQSLSASCTVPNTCQRIRVGEIELDNTNLKCSDINLLKQSSNVSFTCSSNQSAAEMANIVQSSNNTAEAMLGELANSDADVQMANVLNMTLSTKCGGVPPSEGGGACRTGTVQSDTVKSIIMKGDNITCDTLSLISNSNNAAVTCNLQQTAHASEKVDQAATNTAKGVNWIASIFEALFGFVLLAAAAIVIKIMISGHRTRTMKQQAATVNLIGDVESKAAKKVMKLKGGWLDVL